MTNRAHCLLVGPAALTAFFAAASGAGDWSPNVVLIFADDLGWKDVGNNGRRKPGFAGSSSRP